MSEEHLKVCKVQIKLLLFQNPMLVSENFPHFHHTSTIQTQCWFLKLLSHLRPTTTLFYPYRSRFGLDWNQRFFLSPIAEIYVVSANISFHFVPQTMSAGIRAEPIYLAFYNRASSSLRDNSAKIKLRPNPISSYILISHFPNVGDYLNLYAEKYTICWD